VAIEICQLAIFGLRPCGLPLIARDHDISLWLKHSE
jgi:hypothetical protein